MWNEAAFYKPRNWLVLYEDTNQHLEDKESPSTKRVPRRRWWSDKSLRVTHPLMNVAAGTNSFALHSEGRSI